MIWAMKQSIEHWHEQVAYWTKEIESNERLLRIMAWSPALGLPAAGVTAIYHLPAAGLVFAGTLVTVVTGVYMTVVRRFEFRACLRDAQEHVEEAKNDASQPSTGHA